MSPSSGDGWPGRRITVCICTYRRPEGLARLLRGLGEQRFSRIRQPVVTIVVTDNEGNPAVKSLCSAFQCDDIEALRYVHEPRRGISHARNTCLDHVPEETEFVALIDDDEVPAQDWLEQLLVAQQATHADIVIGPVTPAFEAAAPAWIRQSGFFDKPRRQDSLADLSPDPVSATCNALLRAAAVTAGGVRFHPRLALSGGEDVLFFRELRTAGRRFVWAREARVFETIPPEKAGLAYMLREEFRRGNAKVCVDRLMREKTPIGGRRAVANALGDTKRAMKRVLGGAAGLIAGALHRKPDKARMAMNATRIARGMGMLSAVFGIRSEHYK